MNIETKLKTKPIEHATATKDELDRVDPPEEEIRDLLNESKQKAAKP